MNRKNSIVCLLLLFFVTETAMAWPRIAASPTIVQFVRQQ